MQFETIPQKIMRAGPERGNAHAYAVRQDGRWVATTWADYADEVEAASRALIGLGVKRGSPVAILGTNTPEWVIFHVAAMAVGAIPAGIYPTNSAGECAYIINHSQSPVVLVQNQAQLAKILKKRGDLPGIRHIVMMRGQSSDVGGVLTWDEFLEYGSAVAPEEVKSRLAVLEPSDGAVLIYTSGTTGPPKAVVLPHEALTSQVDTVDTMLDLGVSDSTVSYLPLSHIAEQFVTILMPAATGHTVHYESDIRRLAETLQEVRPTVFVGVPRVWEKFYAAISEKLSEASGVKAAIANRALVVGRKHTDVLNRGIRPSRWLGSRHGLFDRLVYSKVKEAMGLDRCRYMFSAAAPLSPVIAEYFAGLGVQILQVYGLSESTGICSISRPDRNRFGAVGPIQPGTELRIADDGEILSRGPHVFTGYLHNPEATADTLDVDGWLHTGDIGRIDDDGFVFITDRKKDIIITAGAENVTPSLIETALQTSALIANAVVIGDRRPYITALISTDPEATAGLSEDEIHAGVQTMVNAANAGHARSRQVRKFVILDEPLSIEHGELTPTLKVRRKVVREHFAEQIEALYG